ncbi:hypothetical protein SHI21_20380 [Bacteriovorax sp. PP10]|uniref:Uncharacterized protein n=1 Tax=Bacteriovorax antarcticus TaxID=3088717 RepID=A0ABU5W030_9BACT|nr:hypothetical protein [Bacteriovorax sp. PP10]MEA9358606.1 hypothetical protein [Bacteriovorax sp. PP10]
MKKIFFIFIFFFFLGAALILAYAAMISELSVQRLYMSCMSMVLIVPVYYALKEIVASKEIKYEFYKDVFIIYLNSNRYKEIKLHEVDSIYFETPYSQVLIFKMSNGEKYKYQPSGLGPKVIHEIEAWWGGEIIGKEDNLSYRRMLIYYNFIRKVLRSQ